MVTTIRKGIEDYASLHHINTSYTKGVNVIDEGWPETEIIPVEPTEKEKSEISKTISMAEKSDVIIAVMGESEKEVGESRSRSSLNLPGKQTYFLQQLYKTGKPIVLVLVNGRPLTINWENKYLSAILETWFLGPQSGKIVAETLFGENNPGGKLPISFPKSIGQLEMNFQRSLRHKQDSPEPDQMDQAAAELQDFYIRLAMVLAIPILNLLTFLCLQKK